MLEKKLCTLCERKRGLFTLGCRHDPEESKRLGQETVQVFFGGHIYRRSAGKKERAKGFLIFELALKEMECAGFPGTQCCLDDNKLFRKIGGHQALHVANPIASPYKMSMLFL